MTATKSILWSYPPDHSVEHFTFISETDHYLLKGTVVCLLKDKPACINYVVRCDASWKTRSVDIHQQWANTEKQITIDIDENQQWTVNNAPLPFAKGLFDVDLEVTPATNTLPIRRFGLNPEESQEVTAVWVRFPDLTLESLRQRYTHVGDGEYIYDSLMSGFRASLSVDDDGVVEQYGDLWKRV